MTHLHPQDRKIFNFDVLEIDWKPYLGQYVLGTRRFILKEDPSTFPAARRHLRKYAKGQPRFGIELMYIVYCRKRIYRILENVKYLTSFNWSLYGTDIVLCSNFQTARL
jgi:hypothetical protein